MNVAIVGAGFGGIATAIKLQQRTSAQFTIFEQSDGVGGTWFDNRYPGCEVDIHSHAYSFSFVRYDWPRTHARQPELLAYANHVVDKFGLRSHIRLKTRVTEVTWIDADQEYLVRTDQGDELRFNAVVAALGLLSVPRYPDWPGLEDFEGVSFHTSRWNQDIDLTGKSVAVVGTGSTAAQVVPSIAPQVKRLHVYQREPGWVEPKHEREFTSRERWMYRRVPALLKLHRAYIFYTSIRRFTGYDTGSKRQRYMRDMCRNFIRTTVDDPDVQAAVTPDYPWGCKRPVLASTYYSAFNNPNVELIPHPVVSVTPTGLVDQAGRETPVDVLVLSTGFQPTKYLATIKVTGVGGADIQDEWQRRTVAFLGITVPKFPNFFILFGPNTNGGLSIIAQLERQAEVAADVVGRMERTGARVTDTDPAMTARYVRWIDRRLAKYASAMDAGCNNYYHSESGANITQWPGTHITYLFATRLLWRLGLRLQR